MRRTWLHVSRRSKFPSRRVCEVREEVREDSLVLGGGEDEELGTWVLVSRRRRGQDVGAGDEWGMKSKSRMGGGGQRR